MNIHSHPLYFKREFGKHYIKKKITLLRKGEKCFDKIKFTYKFKLFL